MGSEQCVTALPRGCYKEGGLLQGGRAVTRREGCYKEGGLLQGGRAVTRREGCYKEGDGDHKGRHYYDTAPCGAKRRQNAS